MANNYISSLPAGLFDHQTRLKQLLVWQVMLHEQLDQIMLTFSTEHYHTIKFQNCQLEYSRILHQLPYCLNFFGNLTILYEQFVETCRIIDLRTSHLTVC